MTVVVDLDPATAATLRSALAADTTVLNGLDSLRDHLDSRPTEDAVVLGPTVDLSAGLHLADAMRVSRPWLGVVLVRRRVDTSVLAEALRAGVREVVEERDLAGLNAAVKRTVELAVALRSHEGSLGTDEGRPEGRLVTVFSAKGGTGKTTLATNMATLLAEGGQRSVCLVDLDLAFGDVAIAMQLMPAHTIVDAVPMSVTLDVEGLRGLLTPHHSGLLTLAAPVRPDDKDRIPAELVARILDLLRREFDWVVVDTLPAFDDVVLHSFDRSDCIVLLATLDVPALKNLKITLETLDLLDHPASRWRVVINRADSKVGLSISDVEKALGVKINAQIPSSRDVPASVNRGVPIVLDDPRSPVSQSIRHFVDHQLLDGLARVTEPGRESPADRRARLRKRSRE